MKKNLISFLLFFHSLSSYAEVEFDRATYFETLEFQGNQNQNHTGMVFICAELARVNGYANDSYELINRLRISTKMPEEYSARLRADAIRWWALKPKDEDYRFFWDDMCEKPFENLRIFLNAKK